MSNFVTSFRSSAGFTLIDILVAIIVLSVVSTVAFKTIQPSIDESGALEAKAEMASLARAIAGDFALGENMTGSSFGYVGDIGAFPSSFADLATNPGGYATWNGPYIRDDFTEDAGGHLIDPWGAAYAYSAGVTITSTGSGTSIVHQLAGNAADLLSVSLSCTIRGANGSPPGADSANLIATITYPDGAGSMASDTAVVSSIGQFSFSGLPVGIYSVRVVELIAGDTTEVALKALPGATSVTKNISMRLSSVSF
ncbi:MAG: hypothetical protein IIB00_06590 [candidate division Zixibacteria bacterium]|nr:hypothetical protein [candidate division Zixibacteria bacterium]